MRTPRPIAAVLCGALAVALLWSGTAGSPQPGVDVARSFLRIAPATSTGPGAGLTPADIASAYGLTGGTSGTVAIATAYSDPLLESDLAAYRTAYGLAPCTSANGCLTVVGQRGTTTLPAADASWGEETSLDVDAVSAACPDCSILVVEASSDDVDDLAATVDTAVRLGADAVSASWGDAERTGWSGTTAASFSHPGVPVVAATGDDGYTAAVLPAALPTVIAVGGTTLTSTSAAGTAAPMRVQDVQGGSVTSATPSTTVAADRTALARTKAALTAAKHRLAAAEARLRRAEAHRAHAATAQDALHWRHRVRDLTTAVRAAARARTVAAKRVSTAEARLLADVLRDASANAATAARTGQADRQGWIETAWSGGGSGCSAVVARPAWQPSITCSRRGTADLAADADPQTGIATYDSYRTSLDTPDGWMVAGGTSLASPLVAAMLVRSGHAAAYSSAEPLYARPGAFWDITGGANGTCSTRVLCTAGVGYDGPTGLGSPRSLDSF